MLWPLVVMRPGPRSNREGVRGRGILSAGAEAGTVMCISRKMTREVLLNRSVCVRGEEKN